MISYLNGKIILKKENFLILEVSGVGYQIFLSKRSLDKIAQIGQNLKLFCYLDIGERSLKLYGFLTYEELELFKLLRNIPGVGPKGALEISSIGPPEKIKKEIEKGNEKIFEGIPGIGKKKARKIILELSGKLKTITPSTKKEKIPEDEVFSALLNLGFKKEEIKKALSQLPKEIKDPQEKIKQALKILGR
jgi:Holliday junction DNA helicase RuvA